MRRRSDRPLSDEDVALWAHVTRGVRAFPGRKAEQPPPAPPSEIAPVSERSATESTPPGPVRPALKPIAPIERRVLTDLRRGRETVQAVIDLHGLRQDDAHARLVGFLRSEQARGSRFVLVITGKGAEGRLADGAGRGVMGGSERGVLKRVVPHWLRLPDLRPVVMGFEEAGLRHGGAGALYVRLRRPGDGGSSAGKSSAGRSGEGR